MTREKLIEIISIWWKTECPQMKQFDALADSIMSALDAEPKPLWGLIEISESDAENLCTSELQVDCKAYGQCEKGIIDRIYKKDGNWYSVLTTYRAYPTKFYRLVQVPASEKLPTREELKRILTGKFESDINEEAIFDAILNLGKIKIGNGDMVEPGTTGLWYAGISEKIIELKRPIEKSDDGNDRIFITRELAEAQLVKDGFVKIGNEKFVPVDSEYHLVDADGNIEHNAGHKAGNTRERYRENCFATLAEAEAKSAEIHESLGHVLTADGVWVEKTTMLYGVYRLNSSEIVAMRFMTWSETSAYSFYSSFDAAIARIAELMGQPKQEIPVDPDAGKWVVYDPTDAWRSFRGDGNKIAWHTNTSNLTPFNSVQEAKVKTGYKFDIYKIIPLSEARRIEAERMNGGGK
jgi:hypothetical protein